MSFFFNGTQANVTLTSSGTTTAALPEKTLSSLAGTRSTSGTTTLGTVGANKIWRIVNATLEHIGSGTAGSITLQFNGVTHLQSDSTSFAAGTPIGQVAQKWDYLQCPKLTAGQTVTLVASANGNNCTATVQYIEEAA